MEQSTYSDINLYINIHSNAEQVYDEYSINQSITSILGTVPGQRLFRPNFGTNIYHKLFEPMGEETAGSIKNMIILAIQRWEPRVLLQQASVIPSFESQSYHIDLQYTIPTLNNKSASFAFALSKLPG